jgi:plasmid stabilization system protein ParE
MAIIPPITMDRLARAIRSKCSNPAGNALMSRNDDAERHTDRYRQHKGDANYRYVLERTLKHLGSVSGNERPNHGHSSLA